MIVWQEDDGLSMLQLEKEIRTRLKVMLKQKNQRVSELKSLIQQDRELCDILCDNPHTIDPDCVPSAQQLNDYRQHIASRSQEKVTLGNRVQNTRVCVCVSDPLPQGYKISLQTFVRQNGSF